MSENKTTFNYTYSARQQEELKKIQQKYIPPEENKMEQLRKLDKSVETPGTIMAIIIGVIGTLLLGVGMTCTMVWTNFFVLGIIVGVIGMGILALAYPVYLTKTRNQREKLAPQIMKLTEELMDNQ